MRREMNELEYLEKWESVFRVILKRSRGMVVSPTEQFKAYLDAVEIARCFSPSKNTEKADILQEIKE